MKEDHKVYVKEMEEFRKDANQRSFYSMQRIDLLIISISSFGILFAANLIKTADKFSEMNTCSAENRVWHCFKLCK